jgi:hypothetical protein
VRARAANITLALALNATRALAALSALADAVLTQRVVVLPTAALVNLNSPDDLC